MAGAKVNNSVALTWLIILLLMFFILIKGYLAIFVVQDRGQPHWDYRPVKDIPGESAYGIYQKLPNPQHIRGKKGE